MILPFRNDRDRDADRILDGAIAGWKQSTPSECLSEHARSRVLRETIEGQEAQPIPVRLRSAAWQVLAGALPVAAIGLLALVFADRAGERDRPLRIRASKSGGEVVFSIANGQTQHSVYKSNAPNRSGTSARIPVHAGSFRDSVGDESGLVFYRIE